MLGSWVAPATPVPSSDHDIPSSPSRYTKHTDSLVSKAVGVATPPPSSPTTRDHPFSLFAEALEHAGMRRNTTDVPKPLGSPIKTDKPVMRRRVEIQQAENVGILRTPSGDVLQANHTHTLVIGRAKVLLREAIDDMSPSFMGTQPAVHVILPSTAKHVSRVHALIRWVPFTSTEEAGPQAAVGTFILRIIGQNGLIVDGQRRRPGQVLRLIPGKTQLDFFGAVMRFVAPKPRASTRTEPVVHSRKPCAKSPIKPHVAKSVGLSAQELGSSDDSDSAQDSEQVAQHTLAERLPALSGQEKSDSDCVSSLQETQESDPSKMDQHLTNTPRGVSKAHTETSSNEHKAQNETNSESVSPLMPSESAKVPISSSKKSSATAPLSLSTHNNSNVSKTLNHTDPGKDSATDEKRCKQEKRTEFSRSNSISIEHVRFLVSQLSTTYDLAGLLAGAIVFHRTATISTSEAVRSVLSSNPGMLRGETGARAGTQAAISAGVQLKHGEVIQGWESSTRFQTQARRAWHEALEKQLVNEPMFGVIERPGKDTTGKPLECWYYYDKENDPDVERAQNLGAFVKPMRNVVRSQKPIFWKKSEYSRATSGLSGGMQDDLLPYSPRNHYSSDPEDAERRNRASTPIKKKVKLA
ncbi:hypothetical protein MYAM1_003119 [Malassezia yamatoensis]|uniref:FHA domain-containing protein n=1 Tax=Malassezia yamatoensis TaxID=253288 RepID=A0AAJ5YVS8_9BASI|nr:hypothetical protein MYAM1_003119 [Malassezia yamatoensis]